MGADGEFYLSPEKGELGGNDALIESALSQMFAFPDRAEALPSVSLLTEPTALPTLPAILALLALPLICLIVGLIRRRR